MQYTQGLVIAGLLMTAVVLAAPAPGGLGIRIRDVQDGVEIVEVLPESPALAAGLVAGEVILAVDGKAIAGMPANDVIAMLKGAPDSAVKLRVKPATGEAREVTVVRGAGAGHALAWIAATYRQEDDPKVELVVRRLGNGNRLMLDCRREDWRGMGVWANGAGKGYFETGASNRLPEQLRQVAGFWRLDITADAGVLRLQRKYNFWNDGMAMVERRFVKVQAAE